jgi:hypothetical protein
MKLFAGVELDDDSKVSVFVALAFQITSDTCATIPKAESPRSVDESSVGVSNR